MTPEPRLRSRRGARSGPKKKRKNGSEKNGVAGPAGPRTVLADAMLTTAGIAALATGVQPSGGADDPSRGATVAGSGRVTDLHHVDHRACSLVDDTRNQAAAMTTIQNTIWTGRRKNHTCHRCTGASARLTSARGVAPARTTSAPRRDRAPFHPR